MRVRGAVAAVALVALAFAITGCTWSAPKITDAQVEEWRALAAEMVPDATETEIAVDQDRIGTSLVNVVFITVHFSNFADLKASYEAVYDFRAIVEEQAGSPRVSAEVVDDSSGATDAEVISRLLEGVPGLESAQVKSYILSRHGTGGPDRWYTVYLYVADPTAVDPDWLDNVSTITQQVVSAAGGTIHDLELLPANYANLDATVWGVGDDLIPLGDLQAIKEFGVDNGCVRTEAWAYDVSEPWAVVYPADATGGACA